MPSTRMQMLVVSLMVVSTVLWTVCAGQDDGTDEDFYDTPAPDPDNQAECVLIIGGRPTGDNTAEYYHPTADFECNQGYHSSWQRLSHPTIANTEFTSGCYLTDIKQVVIREGRQPDKPSWMYGLNVWTEWNKQLPLPYNDSNGSPLYTFASAAASIDFEGGEMEWDRTFPVTASLCLSCGGMDSTSTTLAQCYQFDSTSPTNWTEIPPLPRPLSHSAAVVVGNDSFYIVGGVDSKQVYRYSISEQQWYEETPMAEQRRVHGAAALSPTEFIVCGGFGFRDDCEIYNTTLQEWRPTGNLTTGRQNFALVKFGFHVLALGGYGSGEVGLDSVEKYDMETETWSVEGKKLKHPRHAFVAVVF